MKQSTDSTIIFMNFAFEKEYIEACVCVCREDCKKRKENISGIRDISMKCLLNIVQKSRKNAIIGIIEYEQKK